MYIVLAVGANTARIVLVVVVVAESYTVINGVELAALTKIPLSFPKDVLTFPVADIAR